MLLRLWDKHVFAGIWWIFCLLWENRSFLSLFMLSYKILGVNRNIISKDEIGGITLGIKRNYYEVCKS